MTIGVDLRVLNRGTRTGVEEYTINLLSRLLRLDRNIQFKLFYNGYKKVRFDYDWGSLPNVKLYEFKIPNRLLFASSKYFKMPKIDRLLGGVDIFFAPHFLNSPVSKKCKKVITFHDLCFEYLPDISSWRRKIWQKWLMDIPGEAAKADKIISVSESTRQDLIDLYAVRPEKITVIYSGIGEEFKILGNVAVNHLPAAARCLTDNTTRGIAASSLNGFDSRRCEEAIRKKYSLPKRFILYLGTIEPRKNIIGLIKAFELLKEKGENENLYLVIAGTKGWLYKDIFKTAQNSKYASQIIFTGVIAPSDKVCLYNLASLFVYPSFFEGFGFPPLEAMACGVPVITSFSTSLPEVVGDAALMVDPYNISEISWAMAEILNNSALAEHLIKKGLEQAKKFSWDKCAKETLALIKSVYH